MNKEEKENKKEIEKMLELSNKKFWNSLNEQQKKAVVDKYYTLRSIEHLNIDKVLEINSNLRFNFYILFLGLGLGVFGNMFAEIISNFLKLTFGSIFYNCFTIALFVFLLILGFRETRKVGAEHLGENKVLEHLLDLVKKDNIK